MAERRRDLIRGGRARFVELVGREDNAREQIATVGTRERTSLAMTLVR